MKRWWMLGISVAVVFTVLGCVPRRLFWAPDGKHGAVIDDRGLFICNADGKLSDVVAPDVRLVGWFPDSKRFVAAQVKELSAWREAEALFSEPRRAEMKDLAEELRKEILAHEGGWDQFQPSTKGKLTGGEFSALALYIREQRNEGLPEKFGDEWEKIKTLKMQACELRVYEVSEQGAKAGAAIGLLPDMVMDVRVAPDGGTAAVTAPMASASAIPLSRLLLFSTSSNRPPVEVAEHVAAYFDWSPDGAYLYYGATRTPPTNDKDEFTLGSLTRRPVVRSEGEPSVALGEAEDLAGLLFWSMMKVRCLRDGRVLFSSGEVALPATSADMPKQINLFTIDPLRQPTVTRLLPREADPRLEGLSMGEFELSPDEKRVVVVGSSKNVSVVTLATGNIEAVITAKDSSDAENLPSMPAWRTAEELVLAVPAGHEWGSTERAELVLWRPGGEPRCISREWAELFKKSAENK